MTVVFRSLAVSILIQTALIYGQSGQSPIKWAAVAGKDNEATVFMPAGYSTSAEGETYLGGPGSRGVRIKRNVTAYRLINRVVLLFDYYEGDAPAIQAVLEERLGLQEVKRSTFGEFKMKESSGAFGKHISRVQFFQRGSRLYVLRSIAPTANHGIVRAFFESVRLIVPSGAVAPNATPGATATSIPAFAEQDPTKGEDAAAIEIKNADRGPIFIRSARPMFSFKDRLGMSSVKIKLKVLLSSSGKVTNVEVVSASTIMLERSAVEAAKKAVFIPAEKDGRLVSVYHILDYSYEMRMSY